MPMLACRILRPPSMNALVRRAAGREPPDLGPVPTRSTCTRRPSRALTDDPAAVRRQRHVVGSLPGDGNRHRISWVARSMATTSANDGRDTMRSRPSFEEYMSSTSWVALADQLADREEVDEPERVRRDLLHPLVPVGHHDVDPSEPLERLRVEHVGGAVPVVADEHHAAYVVGAALGASPGLLGGGRRDQDETRTATARRVVSTVESRARSVMLGRTGGRRGRLRGPGETEPTRATTGAAAHSSPPRHCSRQVEPPQVLEVRADVGRVGVQVGTLGGGEDRGAVAQVLGEQLLSPVASLAGIETRPPAYDTSRRLSGGVTTPSRWRHRPDAVSRR